MTTHDYEDANSGKADFEWTYNRLDPRLYFEALGKLDYAIPERAGPVFRRVFDAYETLRKRDSLTVMDIGCSYGINAAVLKYGRKMDELRAHYAGFNEADVTSREMLRADQLAFTEENAKRDLQVVGIDIAQFATAYAFWAGLLDDTIPENLEIQDPSRRSAQTLAKCDLIISTGAVGYVTEATFDRIMACQPDGKQPWIGCFVIRMFDYEPIGKAMEKYGYGTEKLEGRYFEQRRFAGKEEREHVVDWLREKGLKTEGLEDEGHYLAEFYLSRPKADIEKAPLSEIVPAK